MLFSIENAYFFFLKKIKTFDNVIRNFSDLSIMRYTDLLSIAQDHVFTSFLTIQLGEVLIRENETNYYIAAPGENLKFNVSKEGDTCFMIHVVLSAKYYFTSSNKSINGVKLNLVLAKNLSAACGTVQKIKQNFSVTFLTNTTVSLISDLKT